MTVVILERVPASLRGELSRWMIEPRTGVFVGRISALVRDTLWRHLCKHLRDGSAVLIYQTNNEQGYAIRSHGDPTRTFINIEGLTLVTIPLESQI